MLKVSAPGKLMILGDHSVVYGEPCIVTAVNYRTYASLEKRSDDVIQLDISSLGIKYKTNLKDLPSKTHPKEVQFVLRAILTFYEKFGVSSGLNILTETDFHSTVGFGSSSAITVCTMRGLCELFEKKISNQELFDLCYKTVLDIQGVGSGFDIAAAIWGGTLYFIGGGKKIEPLKIPNIPMVVGYTGIKADTSTIVKKFGETKKKYPEVIDSLIKLNSQLVESGLKALQESDLMQFGEIMNFSQGLLNTFGVSGLELEKLIQASRKAGSFGAKLSGAGGGDCMIALVADNVKGSVEAAIETVGGRVVPIIFGAEGVKIES